MSEEATLDEFAESSDAGDSQEWQETPIGELPGDWGMEWLDDIVKINPDGFFEEDWPSETFEYISLSEASDGEVEDSQTTALEDAPSRAQRTVRQGDVLVGTVRPKQRSHGFVSEEHDGKICSSGFGVLRPEKRLNSRYLLQEILSNRFFFQMEAYVAGSGYPAVKISDLKKHRVAIPPLPEQRRIATVLYTIDQTIQKTEEIIEKSQNIKKGLVQNLCTEGAHGHSKYETYRLGPIDLTKPEDWELRSFDEFSYKIQDGPHITPDYVEEGIPFVSSQNVNPFRESFDYSQYKKYISEDTYDEINQNCRPEKGDLIISRRATIGPTQLIRHEAQFGFFVGVAIIKTDDTVHNPFLEQLMNWSVMEKVWHLKSPGSTMKTLNLGTIKNQKIPLPPIEEQKKITEILRCQDNKIANNERYKRSLQRLKQGLMQYLLSGKVSTTDTNIQVPDEIAQYG